MGAPGPYHVLDCWPPLRPCTVMFAGNPIAVGAMLQAIQCVPPFVLSCSDTTNDIVPAGGFIQLSIGDRCPVLDVEPFFKHKRLPIIAKSPVNVNAPPPESEPASFAPPLPAPPPPPPRPPLPPAPPEA